MAGALLDPSWRQLLELALADLRDALDPLLVRSALGCVALARGLRVAGAVLIEFEEAELQEVLP